MGAEFSIGTRVQITRGDHRGKTGIVRLRDGHPVVVCDKDKEVLMAVTTDNAKKV
jgi:hypothetical protein